MWSEAWSEPLHDLGRCCSGLGCPATASAHVCLCATCRCRRQLRLAPAGLSIGPEGHTSLYLLHPEALWAPTHLTPKARFKLTAVNQTGAADDFYKGTRGRKCSATRQQLGMWSCAAVSVLCLVCGACRTSPIMHSNTRAWMPRLRALCLGACLQAQGLIAVVRVLLPGSN